MGRAWQQRSIWPPIDYELADLAERGVLRGLVLNGGAGDREIAHLVDGQVVNQDIPWEFARPDLDIASPLHAIPRPDNTFDAIVCIAVLEHVINPEECVAEMARVLKPSGRLILSVPFMQPEHLVPTDYQRYTRDGLVHLVQKHGLEVEEIKPLFSVYHTLHWLVSEWLLMKRTLVYAALRRLLLPPLAYMARRSALTSQKVASGFRLVAVKP
jgi:SAM-dependent methyltransferase